MPPSQQRRNENPLCAGQLRLPVDPSPTSNTVRALTVLDAPLQRQAIAPPGSPRAAEFFAGIGLVRLAYEAAGVDVVFANDIEPFKASVYREAFGHDDLVVDDVRNVSGEDVPDIEIAAASFPCTDLSLAGNRLGLNGEHSGMFWEFARVLREMGDRRPQVVQMENVPSFATSHGGRDLREAVAELNDLGYSCDLLVIDARRFVPQSRPRLFIVGLLEVEEMCRWQPHDLRPRWTSDFAEAHSDLRMHAADLPVAPERDGEFSDVVETLSSSDPRWWSSDRAQAFVDSLSFINAERLERMRESDERAWATAYRRTREGVARWEIRADGLAGCLRCPRGGSSKQAVVEAGRGEIRIRWMTAREYARLQGVDDAFTFDSVTPTQAMFGFGDAVCVSAVEWLASNYILKSLGM